MTLGSKKKTQTILLLEYGGLRLGAIDDLRGQTLELPRETGTVDCVSIPAMGFEFPEMSAGMDQEPLRITLPETVEDAAWDAFLADLLDGSPFIDLRVTVFEQFDDGRIDTLFWGFADTAGLNVNGKRGIQLTVPPFTAFLNQPAGIECTPQCNWPAFGGNGCWADRDTVSVTITLIDDDRVVLSSSPASAITGKIARWWENGYIERNGARIRIREWEEGTAEFRTTEFMPDSWLNGSALLVQGCYRTPEACQERNNLLNFGGLAALMPDYNPAFGSPQS